MNDDNWEVINGDAAHAIEVLNYLNQVNVIEALIHLLMHHHPGPDGGCSASPNVNVLKEFHRTATLFLLLKPGEFRDSEVVVKRLDGFIVHTPPNSADVESHVSKFFSQLEAMWQNSTPQELGSFSLWMLNWIHPFKNGNGRTARAFCYACIALRAGFVLPGSPTLIDLIMQNRDEYQAALKEADISFERAGIPNLERMNAFVDRLLAQQLSSLG